MGNKGQIYSRIGYEEAMSSRKNILEMQINLLNLMRNIGEYKDLRKKELIWKIKMKSLLKEVKEKVRDIESKVPKSEELKDHRKNDIPKEMVTKEEMKEIKEFKKLKEEKIQKESSIELELEEIKRKLQE